jgi:hypothetical protein
MKSLLDHIIDFITENTYFDKEDQGEDYAEFTTRQFGNVSYSRYGIEDYNEAERIRKLIKERFNNPAIKISISTIDEWVDLSINIENEN